MEGFKIPFIINVVTLISVILLPLNWIREQIGFTVFKGQYERAVTLVAADMPDSLHNTVKLPDEYQHLSVGGGEALTVNNPNCKAILFYTYRGTPDGLAGFVKIINGKGAKKINENFGYQINEIKNMADNWYYISGK